MYYLLIVVVEHHLDAFDEDAFVDEDAYVDAYVNDVDDVLVVVVPYQNRRPS
jgi:hypothetical protein